jgi:hypothetical protein
MRRKRKKKKNNFKKLVGIFTVFFICTLLAMYKYDIKAEGSTILGNNNEVKILEIEPGNKFLFGDATKNELTLIGDCEDQLINNKIVKITHVTMAQFISMIEEVNGKYDVVVIGRNNINLSSGYSKGIAYRDYTNWLSQTLSKLPLSTWEPLTNWKNNYSVLDGIKFGEYYAENDITQKKANEVIQMINSKQLVYIENSIFDLTPNKEISKTKLYNLFSGIQGSNNFRKESLGTLTVNSILERYNNVILPEGKRPQIVRITKPLDDSGVTTAAETNRKMQITITLDGKNSEILNAKLFLDFNADGLFRDKEMVVNLDIQEIIGQKDYELNYTLDNRFVGYLDWKIEITRSNGVKTNVLGNSIYKPLISKKTIKILQIMPDSTGVNLSTNTNFTTLLSDVAVSQDYSLSMDTITAEQVNASGTNFKLNGYYDMVILGFADKYGSKELAESVVNEIKAFAGTGQSVIFTHDTMTPALTNQLLSVTGPKLLTQRFRDYAGQARYPDPYRLNSSVVNEIDVYKNYAQDTDGNITMGDRIIPHDSFNYNQLEDISGTADKSYSLGTTMQGHVSAEGNILTYWDDLNKVKKINNSQINKYPFTLTEEINTALTHTQWYQLNLEDPDVVPWYNMSSSNFDSGDARNYYYTYSKRNITYSGIGHSTPWADNELKLFINTMIKAERGANHKPKAISNIGIEYKETDITSINEVPSETSYSFYVDASDLDDDLAYVDIKINGLALTERNVTMSKLESNGLFKVNTKNQNRSPLKVTIPAEQLPKGGADVTVVIRATDVQGAKSEIKTYKIRPIEMPKFSVNATLDKTKLKKIDELGNFLDTVVSGTTVTVKEGDTVNVSYDIKPEALVYGNARECKYREIAVLLDNSITPNIWASFKNPLSDVLTELLGNATVHANFIAFGDTGAESIFEGSTYQDITNKNYGSKMGKPLGKKKINSALEMSVDYFDSYNYPINETSKNIIIFSVGNVEQVSDYVKSLIDDNYNVITIQISEGGESLALKTVHLALGGIYNEQDKDHDDYYMCNPNSTGSQNHMSAEGIMKDILNKIGSMRYPTYMLENLEIRFNFGNNINLVGNDLIQMQLGSKLYKKVLPKIKFMAETRQDGEVIQTADGKLNYLGYYLDSTQASVYNYIVNFKITTADNAHGLCEFSLPNEVVYNYVEFDGALGSSEISETPKLRLEEFIVNHGVYTGMNGSLAAVDTEKDKLKFATGALVPFASNIQGLYSGPLYLTIDNGCKFEGVIKIYDIDTGVLLKTINSDPGNNIYELPVDYNTNHNVFVMYNVKLYGTSTIYYANYVKIAGVNYPAYIRPSDMPLPDLF